MENKIKTLIINNHTKHLEELSAAFPNTTIINKEDLLETVNISGYNLLIISGGSGISPVAESPKDYEIEFESIKESTIPILGICLGAEIITYAFNGELAWLPEIHKGLIELEILDPELSEIIKSNHVIVHESHMVGIKSVPKDFMVCAQSSHGVEIIKHKNRPIIGIQFHPEISKNTDLFRWIYKELNLLQ